ncbi:MAG: hypothetical protein JST11_03340 [Acidobacteria bacterium]|nr:hypothetical protein [Acidobacteriota bacterium]
MPYSRSTERITAILPEVLAIPEIADELEEKGIRRDIIEKETLARSQRIWEVVAARTDAYDATEKTIESVQTRARIPVVPQYLKWIHTTAWTLVSLVLVAGLATIVFGIMKGWGAVPPVLTRFLSWRNWAWILGNVITISAVLLAWHRHRSRFFAAVIESANDTLKAQLAPLNQQLEADRKIADQSLEQAVKSEVREIISQTVVSWFGTALPDSNAEGLSQVQNPEFEITTAAGERLRRIIGGVSGASIGISGPRGAGKTTLLWANYQIGNTKPDVLSVFTSAPVEYDAREFVLHLFGSVCSRVIAKAVGRREPSTRRRSYESERPLDRLHLMFGGTRSFLMLGTMLAYAGLILAYVKAQAAQATSAAQAAKTPVPFWSGLVAAMDVNPGMLIVWGLVLVVLSFVARPYLRSWLRMRDRRLAESSENPEDVEYERSLEEKGPLVIGAHRQLSNIQFQQSFTSGWSGSLKLPIALEGSMKSDRSWAERQRTLPDIVDDYRRFLERIVGSEDTPYKQVLICIDELDKLESDEAAQRFLNGIKSVFNQARCYYLVSVSENAMSSFERRGLPIRDAFDSSFDEVIQVDYQSLASSKRLLSRRVLNVPDPYLCFCHILAGGLPRDLIRVCRALFDARAVARRNSLTDICAKVIYEDIRTKLRAIAVAAEQQPDLSRNFVSHLLADPPDSGTGIWKLIDVLEYDQSAGNAHNGGAAQKTPLPTEALLYMYFSVTVLELFESMDEARWRKGEEHGLFEQLAIVRRSISQNPHLVAETIARTRSAFGLPVRSGSAARASSG